MKKNISTNSPSEKKVGYSRAVVINHRVYVSGTTSQDELGKTVGKTMYAQTKYSVEKIKTVLASVGFSLNDVVTITAYVVEMKDLDEFDQVFREFFYDIKPCCTMVGVKELVREDLLVEIVCVAEKV